MSLFYEPKDEPDVTRWLQEIKKRWPQDKPVPVNNLSAEDKAIISRKCKDVRL
jgi:hypothetical protein